MWIVLKKELPVLGLTPPRLSIVWATEHIDEEGFNKLAENWQLHVNENSSLYDELLFLSPEEVKLRLWSYWSEHYRDGIRDMYGKTHNPLSRMKFYFDHQEITVFGDEYNPVRPETWNDYIYHQECSHQYMPISYSEEKIITLSDESDLKTLYETAVTEGATPEIAKAMAFMDINPMESIAEQEPLPYGWYCLKPEYAYFFGVDVSEFYPKELIDSVEEALS